MVDYYCIYISYTWLKSQIQSLSSVFQAALEALVLILSRYLITLGFIPEL